MIDAILFDADGVLQRPGENFRATLTRIAGGEANYQGFLDDIWAAEAPCLSGAPGMVERIADVLAKWQSPVSLEDTLAAFNTMRVDAGMLEAVASLRATGQRCCLATNQQSHRARHMEREYDGVFDHQFYSCDLGVAKPEHAYFEAILATLELPADRVLFMDDHESNVTAAQEVGLHAAHFEKHGGRTQLDEILARYGC